MPAALATGGGVILGVIPARYGSTRFPGKALALIDGKPMIQWVWQRAAQAKRLNRLIVATDDRRIEEAVRRFEGEVVMTPANLTSGTDRVWAAAKERDAQIILNIQGDEPLVTAAMVDRLVEALQEDPKAQMTTLAFPMKELTGFEDPNVVKVVADRNGWALYFSRSPIPFYRNPVPKVWYKHLGLYGYRREVLGEFVRWPTSRWEVAESLEQLRALEHGVRIKVLDSPSDTVGVDTPQDLSRVEKLIHHA